MTEWLDGVAAIPDADLPCNVSTVAYAIRVALAYRREAEVWRAQFEEATDGR
jgi:hypothetical protein